MTRAANLMTLTSGGVRRPIFAVGFGIAAAIVICLAIPETVGALGCLEVGMLGSCLGANASAIPGIQPIVLLALVALAAAFTGTVAFEGVRHSRLARALGSLARPASVMGQKVGLVSGVSSAVVAGVARPAIYCSPDLIERLENEELEAVLLHERHHQRTWAPLRLVVLAAAGRFIDWSAAGRRWLDRQRAAIEIAADADVLSAGLPRAVLASAIVKLYDAQPGVAAAGFATAADLRLRALLGEGAVAEDRSRVLPIAGMIAFLVACFALA